MSKTRGQKAFEAYHDYLNALDFHPRRSWGETQKDVRDAWEKAGETTWRPDKVELPSLVLRGYKYEEEPAAAQTKKDLQESCPRCGVGIDSDHDGNCPICARLTDVEAARLHALRLPGQHTEVPVQGTPPVMIDMRAYNLDNFRPGKSKCGDCDKDTLILRPTDPNNDHLPAFFLCTCGYVGQIGVSKLQAGTRT